MSSRRHSGFDRRRFLQRSLLGSVAAVGGLAGLEGLPAVSVQEAKSRPDDVRFRPEIEPLVRLLEETPRNRVLEVFARRIHQGVSYREVLASLLLAGVRNVQPRPVGFKFHCVLVVNSAHLASLSGPDEDRWLPIFWALDQFKSSQARDVNEGNWTMGPAKVGALTDAKRTRERFVQAVESWDEEAADSAVAALVRTAGAADTIEPFWRLGARDFRSIGHKAIFVANSWRTLQTIGWRHAEPVLRSLTYALMYHGGVNPAKATLVADQPGRENLKRLREIRTDWQTGRIDDGATREVLAVLRQANFTGASETIVKLLNGGIHPQSLWDGVLLGSGELLMRQPGIIGLHCVTTANALRYGASACASDETRRYLLLQGAAFMTMFRDEIRRRGAMTDARVDALKPLPPSDANDPLASIFAAVSEDRSAAAGQTLSFLQQKGSAEEMIRTARQLVFLKGRDAHDYKFSSACLEDYYHVSPAWRDRYLATSVFNLRGTGHPDSGLVKRTKAALAGV